MLRPTFEITGSLLDLLPPHLRVRSRRTSTLRSRRSRSNRLRQLQDDEADSRRLQRGPLDRSCTVTPLTTARRVFVSILQSPKTFAKRSQTTRSPAGPSSRSSSPSSSRASLILSQAGDLVRWSDWEKGRFEEVWGEDAWEFRPSRWIGEEGELRKVCQCVAPWFNGGPRLVRSAFDFWLSVFADTFCSASVRFGGLLNLVYIN